MQRLFLIGYRGSGKSTIARLVAERLGWAAVDSDDLIESAAGKSIAAIFAEDGEPAFRDLEEEVVASLCEADRTVVALGGGAVLRETTRERLKNAGPVVWLTASAATLAERIDADTATASRRPSLTGVGAAEEVGRLLAVREPTYRECATVAITVDGRTPEAIADEIVAVLNKK
jgi:shikimate kinase